MRMAPGPELGNTLKLSGNSAACPGPSAVVNCSVGPARRSPSATPAPTEPNTTPGSDTKRGTIVTPWAVPSFGFRTRKRASNVPPGATVPGPDVIVTSRPGQVTPAGGTATAASM